jgi:hypothetical protein
MYTNETSFTEETVVVCDRCGIETDPRSVFTEEKGNHFCLTCWLEKDAKRHARQRLTIVEF